MVINILLTNFREVSGGHGYVKTFTLSILTKFRELEDDGSKELFEIEAEGGFVISFSLDDNEVVVLAFGETSIKEDLELGAELHPAGGALGMVNVGSCFKNCSFFFSNLLSFLTLSFALVQEELGLNILGLLLLLDLTGDFGFEEDEA